MIRAQKKIVVQEAVRTIRRLLEFKLSVDLTRYMVDKNNREFRNFEEEIAVSEEIFGTGVLATPEKLELLNPLGYKDQFLLNEVPLGAHETGEHITIFPLDAAAAAFAFTQLEVFGNEVARIVDEKKLGRASWHQDVSDNRQRHGEEEPRPKQSEEVAKAGFARYLGLRADQVPQDAVDRLSAVKAARNAFAHGDHVRVSFDDFLKDVIGVICHIVFLTTGIDRISVYPFEDHFETFEPQTILDRFR